MGGVAKAIWALARCLIEVGDLIWAKIAKYVEGSIMLNSLFAESGLQIGSRASLLHAFRDMSRGYVTCIKSRDKFNDQLDLEPERELGLKGNVSHLRGQTSTPQYDIAPPGRISTQYSNRRLAHATTIARIKLSH